MGSRNAFDDRKVAITFLKAPMFLPILKCKAEKDKVFFGGVRSTMDHPREKATKHAV
jgi:hypothetical protein